MNSKGKTYHPPQIGRAQISLLERLSNACSVSGDEKEVREIVLGQIKPHVSDLRIDALGNVLAIKEGKAKNRIRVMLAAHMDEVGFMLTHDEGDGIFRFESVGGLEPRQLAGKAVWVGENKVPGVIGIKPIHLSNTEERQRSVSLDMLRIDVGHENGRKVKVGNRATFATSFARLGPSIRAKALDDRLGVATLVELVKNTPTNVDLLAAFTVQEEVGVRGAHVAAYALDPHLAVVLDCTPAMDLPPWDYNGHYQDDELIENFRYNTRLGAGPAIYIADRATLSDPRLIRHLVETAEKHDIPYQFRQPGGGGTDAGAIHKQRAGIPSVSVSVPGRYLHSAASLCRLEDWKHTLNLIHAALGDLPSDILMMER